MNGSTDLNADDMELLAQAQRESLADDQAALDAAAAADARQPAPAPQAPAAQAPAAAPAAPAQSPPAAPAAPAVQAPAAPAADQADGKGHLRAALRAARFESKRLRDELAARGPASAPKAPAATEVDEATMADLDSYAPNAAKALRERDAALAASNARIAELSARVTPEGGASTFIPEMFDDVDIQGAVDTVEELAAWQGSAEHQDKWRAVKAADAFLSNSAAWKNKPIAERFAQAVAMVKADIASSAAAPAPSPADSARARIDALPVVQPVVTAGGLRGGESPNTETLDFHKMAEAGATDEQIMARLN